MRDEYNIRELNPRKNPYASGLKKQITINIDGSTIDYFKSMAVTKGNSISDFDQPLFERLRGQSSENSNVLELIDEK